MMGIDVEESDKNPEAEDNEDMSYEEPQLMTKLDLKSSSASAQK